MAHGEKKTPRRNKAAVCILRAFTLVRNYRNHRFFLYEHHLRVSGLRNTTIMVSVIIRNSDTM